MPPLLDIEDPYHDNEPVVKILKHKDEVDYIAEMSDFI